MCNYGTFSKHGGNKESSTYCRLFKLKDMSRNHDQIAFTNSEAEGSTYICKEAAMKIRESLLKFDDVNDCINIAKSSQ
jgi:hypothetical protein